MSSLAIGNNNIINNADVNNPAAIREAQGLEGRRVQPPPPRKKGYCDKILNGFRNSVAFFAYSVEHSERVQTVVKLGKSVIPFAKYVLKAETPGFNNLADDLNKVDSILDLVDFVNDAKGWFVPNVDPLAPRDDQGHPLEKPTMFWKHRGFTKWKMVSKITGTASRVLGVVKFTLDIGLVKLGQFSAHLDSIPVLSVVLKFSPLRVVKDSFSIVSATFAVVHESSRVHDKIHDYKVHNRKLQKLEAKEELARYFKLGENERQALLQQEIKRELPNNEREVLYLNTLQLKYFNARQALVKLNAPLKGDVVHERQWNQILANYQDENLVDLKKQRCETKIKGEALDIKNNRISRNKHALTIAFNVAKIAAMIIGLVGVFAAAIAGNIVFIAALSTAWLITSTIGITKLYYGYRHQNVH